MNYTSDRVFTGTRTLSPAASKAHRERFVRALARMHTWGDKDTWGGLIEGTRT